MYCNSVIIKSNYCRKGKNVISFIIFSFLVTHISLGQAKNDVLHLISDSVTGKYGYADFKGDTIIPLGKYDACYTEKFDKFAIVSLSKRGIVGIDRNENILFNVYVFDNGPDYPRDGLFRIVKNNKIGYADLLGNIVIKPQYDCAYPFKNGKAKVGFGCKTANIDEHSWWTGGRWVTINKKGKVI